LQGLTVLDDTHGKVGGVVAALDYGAGTFLEIRLRRKDGGIATLPFNKNTVLDVDLARRTIRVNSKFLLS
jgi:ribosomal 30S subunit maturation factor RimM